MESFENMSIEESLNHVDGYLIAIKRNVQNGQYELEVGIPKNWVYKATQEIDFEMIHQTKQGDIIRIFALDENIIVDDLIQYVKIIIETNEEIAKMQEEFEEQMKKAKQELENQFKSFYDQIEEKKDHSFETIKKKQMEANKKMKKKNKDNKEFEKEIEEKLST